MAAHAAAEVHQVNWHVVGVPVDQVADLVDVGGGAGRGVHVDDQADASAVPKIRSSWGRQAGSVGAPAEQEAELQRPYARLAGQREGARGELARPAGAGETHSPARIRSSACGRLDDQLVEGERDRGSGTP